MREKELKKRAERGENDVKGKEKRFEHWQIIAAYLVIYDIFAVNFSYFLGLLLRFDFSFTKIPTEYIHAMLRFIRCSVWLYFGYLNYIIVCGHLPVIQS